jgi:hypothetical protein
MGHSNLIAGTVRSCAGGFGILDAAAGPLEGRCLKPLAAATPALLSVRYEKVEVGPAAPGATGLAGRITDVRYMGATVRIECVGAGGLTVNADMPAGGRVASLAVGQDVILTWPRESAVLIES